MKLNSLIAGLQTFAPYYNKPDGYHTGADHDVIYVYPTDKPMSPDDVHKVRQLGWFQDTDNDDLEPEDLFDVYDANEGWKAYT